MADRVENYVGAAPIGQILDRVSETAAGIVDCVVGTLCLYHRQLFIRSGRCDHFRAQQAADMNGGEADTARRAVDQHNLAGLQPGTVDQRGPGGHIGGAESRAPGMVERGRQLVHIRRIDRADLSPQAHFRARHHPVTDLEAFNPVAQRDHVACRLDPRHKRQVGFELITAGAHQQIHMAEPPRLVAHQHLAETRHRLGLVLPDQVFRRTIVRADYRTHGTGDQEAAALSAFQAFRISRALAPLSSAETSTPSRLAVSSIT